jgi:hypothetical protein
MTAEASSSIAAAAAPSVPQRGARPFVDPRFEQAACGELRQQLVRLPLLVEGLIEQPP